MAKTKQELDSLKKDYEDLSGKLKSLSDEELKYVVGGFGFDANPAAGDKEEKTDTGCILAA